MIDQRCYGCGTRNRGGDSACDNPIRIRRVHLEERFLQNVREQLLDDKTVRWAEKEVARRLAVPAADTAPGRRELSQVEGDLVRVVNAIAKMGFSAALESKLAELEARKHTLLAELQAAKRTIQLPDASAITAKWRAVIENLSNLTKMATASEVETARRSLRSLLGTVRVDRTGRGFADLSLHVPTGMVAGAGFGCSIEPIELRRR